MITFQLSAPIEPINQLKEIEDPKAQGASFKTVHPLNVFIDVY